MAKKARLDLEVDVVNNTASGLKEVEDTVAEVADNMGKSAKKPKKDWGGVLELFTGALPRGFQKSIRQFKSVRRSVGRLSKSFKLLKISIAALGLPALILAIEALASNWQSVTDFLGFTNKAQREAREEFAETAGELARVNEMGKEYEKILINANSKTDVFNATIEKLNQQFGNAIDTEGTLNEQRNQGLILIEKAQNVERAQIDVNKTKQKILEQTEKIENLEFERKQKGAKKTQEQIDLEKNRNNQRALLVGYTESLTKAELALAERVEKNQEVLKSRAKTEKELIDQQKKEEAEAAKRAAERDRIRVANEEFVRSSITQIMEDAHIDGLRAQAKTDDEFERLLLQHEQKKQRDELRTKGATYDEIELMREHHDAVLQKFDQEVKDREDEAAEDRAMEQVLLMEQLEKAAMSEKDQRLLELADEYTRQQELAGDNADLLLLIEEDYQRKREQLEKDTNDEIVISREEGINQLVKGSRTMFASLERAAEDGSAAQKALAITDILLQQGVAMANAVAGATKAASAAGPGAPFALAGYIATMVGAVVSSFVGIKGILAEADADTGGVGGDTVTATRPLIPTMVARTETAGDMNIQSFVVQSELQGANLTSENLYGQTSLNPG